jgi:hypothetical protein
MQPDTAHVENMQRREDVQRRAATRYSPHLPLDALLTRGVTAGLTGGLAFILVNMFAAQSAGKPPIAPFLAISTIFRFSEMPIMSPMAAPVEVTLGVIVGYGLMLYVVNFQVVGRLFFPWFVDPRGRSQVPELLVHPLAYGLLLVPFFVSVVGHHPSRSPCRAA